MTEQILFAKEGREKIMAGVDKLANAVKSTLGAKGKNVIIGSDYGHPIVTKDGVTVARHIMLNDYIENMGASLVKEVANKTAEVAGDGTTTATVLAQAILRYGIDQTEENSNLVMIKSGIDKGVKVVVEKLKELSKVIEGNEQLVQIASISANNDSEVGQIIAEAVAHVGVDGVITVEDSDTILTYVEKEDGVKFNQGYLNKLFVKDQNRTKIEMEDVVILLYDKKISAMADITPLLVDVINNKKSILIIAEDVEGEALKSLLWNNYEDKFKVCCVKNPGYGQNKTDMMNDLALLTGGMYVSDDIGMNLKEINIRNLGIAKKVIISENSTVISGGKQDNDLIQERIKDLKERIESPSENDVPFLKHRLGNLSNGIATVYVGGSSQTEVNEKKDRIDDALNATISSMEEGYVAGAGIALLNCLTALDEMELTNKDEKLGQSILLEAIKSPFMQILKNAGIESRAQHILEDVLLSDYGMGYNVKSDQFENLFETGIIDPTKVTRVALENAASVAGLFLTTDCIIQNASAI